MGMDRCFDDLSFSIDAFDFGSRVPLHNLNQSPNFANGFKPYEHALGFDPFAVSTMSDDVNNMPEVSVGGEFVFPGEADGSYFNSSESLGRGLDTGDEPVSSSYENKSLDPVFEYISQMIMEDNLEDQEWIFADDLALRNTEKSLYDVLGEQYPDFPDQSVGRTSSKFLESNSEKSSGGTSLSGTNSIDPNGLHDLGDVSGLVENTIDENASILQFKRGLEEASKFLPTNSQLMINFETVDSGSGHNMGIQEVDGHGRGRKNHEREDLGLLEVRDTKQTASSPEAEEAELSELIDKVLLCTEKVEPECSTETFLSINASEDLTTSAPPLGSDGGRVRGRRPRKSSSVDLRALLIQSAQAVASNDLRAANELLKQVRANSSPSGDGSERLAHYFANGLQARMEGSRNETQCFYASLATKRRSAAHAVKAYQHHSSSCPFVRISIFYANYMIWKLSRNASVLHIIDFGIGFGFRWPLLIQKLGEQADGPQKLRITGIEFPQPGFRPTERIEEAGRRLAKYCERFNIPFEFNALPSLNWEEIKIEDLKIQSGEFIAVSSMVRFKNLLDETVAGEESPRDAVLNLIRRIKPDIFINTTSNGYYNVPFFVIRFREALFHLSSIYDMLDATVTGGHMSSEGQKVVESEIYGQEVMNVIACEGVERVERPETYKMWQIRHERAGFKQLPLDQAVMNKFRHQLKAWYHKDFALDDDENWMLFGWKGRILYATTAWVPV